MSVALCPSQRHEFVRAEVVHMPSDTVSITVEEARKDILKKVSRNISAVQKPLRDIVGCILAQDVASPIAVPAYTNSAMDGFAFKASDLRGKKELTHQDRPVRENHHRRRRARGVRHRDCL